MAFLSLSTSTYFYPRAFFDGEGESVKNVEVVLRPQVWNRIVKHGKEQTAGAPAIITPLVTSALLNREGFLFPAASATIPRDLLEPLPSGHFSIGELVQYDKYKTTHNTATINEGQPEHYEETETSLEIGSLHLSHTNGLDTVILLKLASM